METKAGRTFSITELRANWLLNVSGSSLRVYVNWSPANIRDLLCSYIYFYFWLLWKVCFICHQHWDMWVNTLLGSWWREGILSILKGILAVQCDFLKKKTTDVRYALFCILHLESFLLVCTYPWLIAFFTSKNWVPSHIAHYYNSNFALFSNCKLMLTEQQNNNNKNSKAIFIFLIFLWLSFFFFFNQVSLTHILGYLNLCMFPEFFLIFSFPLMLFFSCYSFPSFYFHIACLFCSISSYFSTSLWRDITFFALLSQNFHEVLCQVSLNYVGQIALA